MSVARDLPLSPVPEHPPALLVGGGSDRLQLYRLGPGSSWRMRYPQAGALLTSPSKPS
jgi:hypothetical protein